MGTEAVPDSTKGEVRGKMSTISIIGSGGMAAAIGGRIAKAGHTVEMVSRDPAKARALADKLAAGAATGAYGAAPAGDISHRHVGAMLGDDLTRDREEMAVIFFCVGSH